MPSRGKFDIDRLVDPRSLLDFGNLNKFYINPPGAYSEVDEDEGSGIVIVDEFFTKEYVFITDMKIKNIFRLLVRINEHEDLKDAEVDYENLYSWPTEEDLLLEIDQSKISREIKETVEKKLKEFIVKLPFEDDHPKKIEKSLLTSDLVRILKVGID